MTLDDHGGEREIESDQVLWIEWSGEKKTEQTVINNNEKSVAIHHQATDLDLLIFFKTSFPYSFSLASSYFVCLPFTVLQLRLFSLSLFLRICLYTTCIFIIGESKKTK